MLRNIVLFGSRAKGNNTERSDIDMAVYGGDFDGFYWDIKENIHSLLMFDVINADASISEELKKEIKKTCTDFQPVPVREILAYIISFINIMN